MTLLQRLVEQACKLTEWQDHVYPKTHWIALTIAALVAASSPLLAESATSGAALEADTAHFTSQTFGITLDYPSSLKVLSQFPSSYLMPQPRWNHRGPLHVPGQALVALELPDSNAVKRGLLRLGASNVPKAVQDCLFTQSEIDRWVPGVNKVRHVRIDDVDFQMVTSGGAAAGHGMSEELYRAVHDGHCIAVDLIVAGSWAVDEKPAFSTDEAFQRLTELLQGLHFIN